MLVGCQAVWWDGILAYTALQVRNTYFNLENNCHVHPTHLYRKLWGLFGGSNDHWRQDDWTFQCMVLYLNDQQEPYLVKLGAPKPLSALGLIYEQL